MAGLSDVPPSDSLSVVVEFAVEAALPPELAVDDLHPLALHVLEAEGAVGAWAVTVALVGDDRLRALHRDFMGLDSPTDVMTFPLGDLDDEGPQGGDVVVSMERAAEQAADFGHTPAREVRFLIVHGLLHLAGWDDASDAERTRMLDRQQELLDAFDRERPGEANG